MSLINDALIRARQSQQGALPPPHDLPLRPHDEVQPSKKWIGLVLPATFITVLIAALFSFWQLKQRPSAPPVEQVAQSVQAAVITPVAAPEPAPPPTAVPTKAVVADQDVAITNAAPAPMIVPPPPPPVPKLQAIVFNPTHPSAIINGQTVFVGDRLGEFEVASISHSSATIVSSSRTNVLKLE